MGTMKLAVSILALLMAASKILHKSCYRVVRISLAAAISSNFRLCLTIPIVF